MSEKTLVYVFDPLCGWCYGFSPVVRQLFDATRRRAGWQILSGGMVVGDRVGPIGRISDFLKQALPRVEGTTGVKFGPAFTTGVLEPGTLVLSSVEPSRALQAVKALAPQLAFEFASALQEALYDGGQDITSFAVLSDLAESLGIVGFEIEYLKAETYDRTFEEFRTVGDLGVTGFPCILGFSDTEVTVFSRGWTSFDRVFDSVNRWLDR